MDDDDSPAAPDIEAPADDSDARLVAELSPVL